MSIMHKVREAIDPAHQAIEETEFSKSLLDGRITRAAYCQYLTQMWHIHYQLEHTLPNCEPVAKYFEQEMVRTPALEHDLFTLGSAVELQSRMSKTLEIEKQLQAWASTAPYALLGCCYILEGSRMGSLMIGRALMRPLELQVPADGSCAAGVEYHLENATQTPRRVKQLKSAIDAGGLSTSEAQDLTNGACTFMKLLNELYQQLPVYTSPIQGKTAKCPVHGMLPLANLRTA